ncbi:MAG: hypothetical protein A2391_00165 [Candidatus Brennerbacteria bacterium RIFOXYB1_FULL_41_13]|nr:MAG: hypothetical protein A2391_00165 [Candidatus Brennerbacteria bacterium RIFOXYB1_FULL_41_13]
MFFINAIIFGVILLILDKIVATIFKQKISILDRTENGLDAITHDNPWLKLLILLGIPTILFFLQGAVVGDSAAYWIITILFVVSLGYLGVPWFRLMK